MKKISLIAASLILASCASTGGGTSGNKKDESKEREPATRIGTLAVARSNACPSQYWDKEPESKSVREAAFAAALAPVFYAVGEKIIDKGFDLFVKWLKEREAKLNSTTTATATADFYDIDELAAVPKLGCLIFVHGELGEDKQMAATTDKTWTERRLNAVRGKTAGGDADKRQNIPEDRRISLVKPPLIYAEFRFEYASAEEAQREAFQLVPEYLDYSKVIAENPGTGIKDLAFAISMSTPGKGGDAGADKTFASFAVALPKVPTGTLYRKEALADKGSKLQGLPTPVVSKPDAEQKDTEKKQAAAPQSGQKGQKPPPAAAAKAEDKEEELPKLSPIPTNISVTFTESEPVKDFEHLVVEAVEAAKDPLAKLGKKLLSKQLGLPEEEEAKKK
jgi:hypothetical protein